MLTHLFLLRLIVRRSIRDLYSPLGRSAQWERCSHGLSAASLSGTQGEISGAAMLELRILHFEDLTVGMSESFSKVVSSSDVVGFAELTGDRNPIHLAQHFAAKTPFKTRIAHGLYTASLISAVLGTRLPGPGAIYIAQTLNFRAPVRIGDTVHVQVEVVELIPDRHRARLACTCRVGEEVVLDGEALIKVPSAANSPPLLSPGG